MSDILETQNLAILGSTGSIGTQTLDIVRQHPERFKIFALTAHKNSALLAKQINEFCPAFAVITDEAAYNNLRNEDHGQTKLLFGYSELYELVKHPDIDVVLNSLVGFAGFQPTFNALEAGKRVALANKESLVVGGELISELIKKKESSKLIPVDSEHSAMLQSLVGENSENIEKIIITASGGPFRSFTKEQMAKVTVEQALKHPNWDMGAKITIDSATMMNKGLEIIEAHWLFDLPISKIEPVIHPQSIIHSIVTFVDGSSKAQLGPPDMKVPINYALSYPDRLALDTPRMNWDLSQELTFEPVDYHRFPAVKLAMESIEEGNMAPVILNAANEVAIARFLNKEIGYIDIPIVVEKSLEKLTGNYELSVEEITKIDNETRLFASRIN